MSSRRWLAGGLLALTSLLALLFLASPGTPDVGVWLVWMTNLSQHGLRDGYIANQADYPPLTSLILWGVMGLAGPLNVEPFWALKGSLLGFLGATTLIWLVWTRNLMSAALLQLSLILNSVALGYLDILFAPTLILALWALAVERWMWFGLLFGITGLIKWQPLVLAPLVGVYLWRRLARPNPPDGKMLIGPVALGLGVWVGFGGEVFRSLGAALAHPMLSANALNLGWIITHGIRALSPDGFGGLEDGVARYIMTTDWRLLIGPKVIFWGLYLLILYRCWRDQPTFETWLTHALASYLAYFTFNTGVHENHLFLAMILAAVLSARGQGGALFGVVALAANINLLVFYSLDGQGLWFSRVAGVDVALPLAVLNVVLFGGYCIGVIRRGNHHA